MAQQLLHRPGPQLRLLAKQRKLVRMPEQRKDPVGDQVDRGFLAGSDQQHGHRLRLVGGQAVRSSVHVDQRAQEVRLQVGRTRLAPLPPLGGQHLPDEDVHPPVGLVTGPRE